MRLVFAGTPDTALPALEALQASDHELAAVVTRPDAPAGRGRRIASSPVATRARELGIELPTPRRPSDPAFLDRLQQLRPDCCPVVAYGALIPGKVLAIPARGWVNLHFSILPAWRGAAPVPHALMAGDEVTGATVFELVPELDAGPTLGLLTERIRGTDTAGDLLERLATHGATLLLDALNHLETGEIEARPQPEEGLSYAPKLTASDARIDWATPARAIDRRIRGCTPAPGAWTTRDEARLKVGPIRFVEAEDLAPRGLAPGGLVPGEIGVTKDAVHVGTTTGPVELGDVQPHGKRQMRAADWARGVRLGDGARFD